jgi:hypothetical protein
MQTREKLICGGLFWRWSVKTSVPVTGSWDKRSIFAEKRNLIASIFGHSQALTLRDISMKNIISVLWRNRRGVNGESV